MMGHLFRDLYAHSPREWIAAIRRRWSGGRRTFFVPPTAEFLRSPEYQELMNQHRPFGSLGDRHEAQTQSTSFRFRATGVHRKLGAFRWRGMQEHLDLILDQVLAPDATVLDFGGAAFPLGLGSMVVDRLSPDAAGRPVPYRDLAEVPHPVDVIFSSHCLEHIADLDGILRQMRETLKPGGSLLLFVPAFTCVRWRVSIHTNSKYQDHVWTFALSGTDVPKGLQGLAEIDTRVAEHFTLERAEYCGDDSIFIHARRPRTESSVLFTKEWGINLPRHRSFH